MKTIVLGVGNILVGDEGAGVHVAHLLQKSGGIDGVEIVDGGTGGFHLLEYFEDYERVILVDATLDGQPPGTLTILRPQFSSDYPPTLGAHDIGLKDLLDSVFLLGRHPKVVLFAISVARLETISMELSEPVSAAVTSTARAVTDYLRDNPGEP
jgi:hydrogenase maturation protease